MTDIAELRSVVQRWLQAEPDADMRAELADLLAGPEDTLVERFTGRLQFGTAGLRAAVGAGPQRMNRLVVQQAERPCRYQLLKRDGIANARRHFASGVMNETEIATEQLPTGFDIAGITPAAPEGVGCGLGRGARLEGRHAD